jgi:hypothetical protein
MLRYDDGPCHHSLRRTSTAPHRTAPHSSGASESAHAASARRTKRLHTEAASLLPRPGNRRVVQLAAAPAPHRIADGSCTMFRDTYVTSASNTRVPRPRALAQIEREREREGDGDTRRYIHTIDIAMDIVNGGRGGPLNSTVRIQSACMRTCVRAPAGTTLEYDETACAAQSKAKQSSAEQSRLKPRTILC